MLCPAGAQEGTQQVLPEQNPEGRRGPGRAQPLGAPGLAGPSRAPPLCPQHPLQGRCHPRFRCSGGNGGSEERSNLSTRTQPGIRAAGTRVTRDPGPEVYLGN